jgi:hypothetical protein
VAAGQREYPGHNGDSVLGRETHAVVWLRAAGGAVQRAQAPRVGVGEPLPVHLAGELGELVHDGYLLSCPVVCVRLCSHSRHQCGRSPCVTANRTRTGLQAQD